MYQIKTNRRCPLIPESLTPGPVALPLLHVCLLPIIVVSFLRQKLCAKARCTQSRIGKGDPGQDNTICDALPKGNFSYPPSLQRKRSAFQHKSNGTSGPRAATGSLHHKRYPLALAEYTVVLAAALQAVQAPC